MQQVPGTSAVPEIPQPPATRIDVLEQDFYKLKNLVEKEHKGFAGWAKRWGAVLALFVALFGFPRGVLDAYHVFSSRPNTELVSGSDLVLNYDPSTRNISFAVEFGAANTGTRDDFLRDLSGNLKNESAPQAQDLPFGIPDILCTSQGTRVGFPFPVRTTEPISVSCTFTSQIHEPSGGPFEQPGSYHLAMNVNGLAKERQKLDFCFYVDDKMLSDLFASTKLETARFLYPDCRAAQQ